MNFRNAIQELESKPDNKETVIEGTRFNNAFIDLTGLVARINQLEQEMNSAVHYDSSDFSRNLSLIAGDIKELSYRISINQVALLKTTRGLLEDLRSKFYTKRGNVSGKEQWQGT